LVEKDKSGKQTKEHGINRNSILNQLKYYNVCDGFLILDVMHDLLEGVLQYEVKQLLQAMTQNNVFSLELLNTRLENLELGHMESNNRPSLIAPTTLHGDGNKMVWPIICYVKFTAF